MLSRFSENRPRFTAQIHSLSLSTSLPFPGRPRASACFSAKARLMRVPENVIGSCEGRTPPRKLSNFNFQLTKILYQNNVNDIVFFFTFFKS